MIALSILRAHWAPVLVFLMLSAMVGYIGEQRIEIAGLHADVSKAQADIQSERAGYEEQARIKSEKYRAQEAATRASQSKAIDDAITQKTAAEQARAASDDALKRLRNAATRRGGAACNSAPASSSPAASDIELVPAQLLDRVGEAARELAGIADARGIAGQACIQSYNALKTP